MNVAAPSGICSKRRHLRHAARHMTSNCKSCDGSHSPYDRDRSRCEIGNSTSIDSGAKRLLVLSCPILMYMYSTGSPHHPEACSLGDHMRAQANKTHICCIDRDAATCSVIVIEQHQIHLPNNAHRFSKAHYLIYRFRRKRSRPEGHK